MNLSIIRHQCYIELKLPNLNVTIGYNPYSALEMLYSLVRVLHTIFIYSGIVNSLDLYSFEIAFRFSNSECQITNPFLFFWVHNKIMIINEYVYCESKFRKRGVFSSSIFSFFNYPLLKYKF